MDFDTMFDIRQGLPARRLPGGKHGEENQGKNTNAKRLDPTGRALLHLAPRTREVIH